MTADQIIAILDTLTAADLRKVGTKVDELRSLYDAWQRPSNLGAASGSGGGVRTYRQEYVRCNKPTCTRCADAPGHGPYWYVYWRESGKLRKQYIGKQRPTMQHGAQEPVLLTDDVAQSAPTKGSPWFLVKLRLCFLLTR